MEASFIEEFSRLEILRRSRDRPGFVSGELSRTGTGWPVFALTTLWESEAAYRAWLRSARPLRRLGHMEALMEEPGPGDLLHVVEQHSRPAGAGQPVLAPLV